MSAMVSVVNLGRRFDQGWIFRDLNFELGQGDCLIVRGRNGAGKSTLLRIIAGLLVATEGTVTIGDSDFGYFALDTQLYSNLNPLEHIKLAEQLKGIPTAAANILERIGLAQAAERPCAKLSTGMRHRVKLALAMLSSPSVLLLDEPTAAMDDLGRALVEEVCQEQVQRGSLIVATNDPHSNFFATHELVL